jgi:hypothetical protein
MRKSLLVLLLLVSLGAAGSLALARDDGYGDKIAGTWFGNFEFFGTKTPFIQTYNADGTAQTSSTNRAASLHHLTWEKTGSREITWRLLHFNYNDIGLAFISRTYGVQTYDRKYKSFRGEFVIEACPCDPFVIPAEDGIEYDCTVLVEALTADPNDPDVCVNPPLPPGTVTGARMDVGVSWDK